MEITTLNIPSTISLTAASAPAPVRLTKIECGLDQLHAFSINQFCQLHGLSRGSFYNFRRAGTGPKESRAGRRVLITKANAAEWLARS
jgi:predicted DNA-binding transcriptional regulator AlpA